MLKSDALSSLRNAKRAHTKWVMKALAIIEGIPIQQDQVPVQATDCVFGKWYLGEGQLLRPLAGFIEIDRLHQQLHHNYQEIFALLFESKPSLFAKLFGKTHSASQKNIATAKAQYQQLDAISKQLLAQIEVVEQALSALSEPQFQALIGQDTPEDLDLAVEP